jgi:hypothetical protein
VRTANVRASGNNNNNDMKENPDAALKFCFTNNPHSWKNLERHEPTPQPKSLIDVEPHYFPTSLVFVAKFIEKRGQKNRETV